MSSQYYSRIVSAGSAFPERVMPNAEFEKFIETSDEWIRTRTGIETRRISDPAKGESTASLSEAAAREALRKADMSAADLDMIVVGTVTPDSVMPCVGNTLQAKLGAKKAFTFDLQAACSGYLYGLSVADQYIRSGMVKNALVIGAETLSTVVNWQDRKTCVLFGDGAGATVVTRSEDPKHRILGTKLYSDGTYGPSLDIPHGYGKVPPYSAEYRHDLHKIRMCGGEIFKLAVRNMVECSLDILKENNLSPSDVNFFIFHQANLRIIDMCLKTLNIDREKTWLNVAKYGNTSSATLPVCLDEAWAAGKVKPGDLILMSTFGGGVTWASALFRL